MSKAFYELNTVVQDKVVNDELQLHLLLRKVTTEFETVLEEFFSAWGITTTRFVVLNLLYNSPQGMTPTETAKAVGVTNATISAVISNLKQSGLIQPVQNAGDSRSYRMVLSDSGLELMRKIYPSYNENIHRLWSQFDGAERVQLSNLMTRISQLLGVMGKKF